MAPPPESRILYNDPESWPADRNAPKIYLATLPVSSGTMVPMAGIPVKLSPDSDLEQIHKDLQSLQAAIQTASVNEALALNAIHGDLVTLNATLQAAIGPKTATSFKDVFEEKTSPPK